MRIEWDIHGTYENGDDIDGIWDITWYDILGLSENW